MTNIKDVAQKAGVSVTTVSRVFNNRGYISKETREKVMKAMEEVDYQPNQIARALQKSQSYLIGVIVPDSNHPFFSDLVKYIEMYASEKNYKILLCNSLGDAEKEANYISMLRQNRVDGIIMCSHTLQVEQYKKANLPIVSFDRILSNNIPYVGSDNFLGGELATRHLIENGCKNLLHISGPSELDSLPNRRTDAFKLTCMKHDIPFTIVEGALNKLTFDYFWDFINKEVSKYLRDIDGVFCSNDTVAYALYIYAIKNGIKVPEDLQIVGYDNHSFTRMLQTPRLTTISQPTDRIGKVLSNTLIKIIEKEDTETINNTIIDVSLIQGDTTRPLSVQTAETTG
ncbi:LacI family DNA-binding transcriptional regulator [Bacillus marinisedimentorum]|uniref:LacI family DNA-binding transcriptional regulator n=1 Tax=Bacillus marinisedimentorum TaxID=1821260 RepID=UPI0007E0B1D9|nr:LacI family DNA-binding transcriptional regulator [Bacillus marinisedimentorum]